MTDYGKKLPCEELNDTDFIESQSRRARLLQSTRAANPQEVGFIHENTNLNNIREKVEKSLRAISKTLAM